MTSARPLQTRRPYGRRCELARRNPHAPSSTSRRAVTSSVANTFIHPPRIAPRMARYLRAPPATSEYVHDETWLDFHTCQSGHARNSANWRFIEADYARTPPRPCMDAEPGYEDMADNISNLDGGYLDDWDARKALYWSLFAGAHGHTYGCNPVWQMWTPGRQQVIYARRPWYEAMYLPGSGQMQHAAALLLSRPFLSRIPDQSLIASDPGAGTQHIRASRDSAGRYVLVYIPAGNIMGSVRSTWIWPTWRANR